MVFMVYNYTEPVSFMELGFFAATIMTYDQSFNALDEEILQVGFCQRDSPHLQFLESIYPDRSIDLFEFACINSNYTIMQDAEQKKELQVIFIPSPDKKEIIEQYS